MLFKRKTGEVESFVTLDGSEVREIVHPSSSPVENQSLAEAIVPGGGSTRPHVHRRSEEIYYILRGTGIVVVDGERAGVESGTAVLIPPGTEHSLENTGDEDLVLLCASSPPYSDEDTRILED